MTRAVGSATVREACSNGRNQCGSPAACSVRGSARRGAPYARVARVRVARATVPVLQK